MIEVDQTYKLIFNINNAHKIAIDGTLLKTLKNDDKSNLPENTAINEDFSFCYITYNKSIKLKLFRESVITNFF